MSQGWNVRRFDRAGPLPGGPGSGPYVVLDNIRSAFNVGAIFRTCEAAGVRRLFLCGISACPPNPRVLKTSLGTEESLPWEHCLSAGAVIDRLRGEGAKIVAVELTDRSQPLTAFHFPPETALVFGHEVAGVAVPILEQADAVVEVPMQGRKNSLNVATSVGVILFEHLRQRLVAD